jgi:two-component system LytT family response regulator
MKVLIIDNEENLRKGIRELLLAFCTEVSVIAEASGVQDGLMQIRSFQPDIVLLDVEMEDGTGFDLLKKLTNPQFQLIFVTAHNEYAIEAFRFSAIDYLLKPVDPDQLQAAIRKASSHILNNKLQKQVEILLQQISGIRNPEKKIVLKDMENTWFIKVADILYCEAEGTYTKFHIQDMPAILVSKNLKEYESILEPLGFVRTHHSFLANPDKIKSYDKTDGGSLVLEGNISIPVSQRKKEFVMHLLEHR